MNAVILFSGSGPILILSSFRSVQDPELARKLLAKGIKKYMLFELDLSKVKERYGQAFLQVAEDLGPEGDLRVLDYNGHNVFHRFPFREFGAAIYQEL